jgi:Ca2+-dependent lipid-binding protein
VKVKIGNRQFYKSRTIFKNLNPKWEEKFTLPIEDPFRPVSLRVFDYDRGMNDDPMGGAEIDPSSLELDK